MKRFVCLIVGCIFAVSNPTFLYAHTEGATLVHELAEQDSPRAVLDIQKDPTGGFNVQVKVQTLCGVLKWHQCNMYREKVMPMCI